MYVLKTLEVFSELEYVVKAEKMNEYSDYKEILKVPLPDGKTFDDVQEWKMIAEGEIEYRMKGETDFILFKP